MISTVYMGQKSVDFVFEIEKYNVMYWDEAFERWISAEIPSLFCTLHCFQNRFVLRHLRIDFN